MNEWLSWLSCHRGKSKYFYPILVSPSPYPCTALVGTFDCAGANTDTAAEDGTIVFAMSASLPPAHQPATFIFGPGRYQAAVFILAAACLCSGFVWLKGKIFGLPQEARSGSGLRRGGKTWQEERREIGNRSLKSSHRSSILSRWTHQIVQTQAQLLKELGINDIIHYKKFSGVDEISI